MRERATLVAGDPVGVGAVREIPHTKGLCDFPKFSGAGRKPGIAYMTLEWRLKVQVGP